MPVKPKLIVGNWKCNPTSLKEAKKTIARIRKGVTRVKSEVVITPPAIFVKPLLGESRSGKLSFGVQNIASVPFGAHTGEIAASMVKEVGGHFTIIGHSERRATGETDEEVNKKVLLALEAKLTPIICVGEGVRDEEGKYFSFVQNQIEKALKGVAGKDLRYVTIAYEPIWAIGSKSKGALSPSLVEEMAIFIRRVLSQLFDTKQAASVRILYGGSVNPDNTAALLEEKNIGGLLVGRASLNPDTFLAIIQIAEGSLK